jgi:TPR repeat protein
MHREWLLALTLVIETNSSAFAQSMVQRCGAMLRARSADAGWAEVCQGVFEANGTNGPQDQRAAFQHYQRAAELGNAEGQALLGAIYENGWAGISRDIGRAVSWYQKAAQQGHPGAELNLGLLYERGDGVPKDAALARSLIEAAAVPHNGNWRNCKRERAPHRLKPPHYVADHGAEFRLACAGARAQQQEFPASANGKRTCRRSAKTNRG